MRVVRRTVTLDLEVRVEERDGYWAATAYPFGITAYADTGQAAEERAIEAIRFRLERYSSDLPTLTGHLSKLGIKYLDMEEPTLMAGGSQSLARNVPRHVRQELRIAVG